MQCSVAHRAVGFSAWAPAPLIFTVSLCPQNGHANKESAIDCASGLDNIADSFQFGLSDDGITQISQA